MSCTIAASAVAHSQVLLRQAEENTPIQATILAALDDCIQHGKGPESLNKVMKEYLSNAPVSARTVYKVPEPQTGHLGSYTVTYAPTAPRAVVVQVKDLSTIRSSCMALVGQILSLRDEQRYEKMFLLMESLRFQEIIPMLRENDGDAFPILCLGLAYAKRANMPDNPKAPIDKLFAKHLLQQYSEIELRNLAEQFASQLAAVPGSDPSFFDPADLVFVHERAADEADSKEFSPYKDSGDQSRAGS